MPDRISTTAESKRLIPARSYLQGMTPPRLTRRQVLAAASAAGLGSLAGCTGFLGDDDATMTLMIERIRRNEDDPSRGPIPFIQVAHTCSHLEEIEPTSLDASGNLDDAVTANRHEPYEVTLPGGSGYVAFNPPAIDAPDDRQYGFFTAGGRASAQAGTAVHEETGVEDCDEIERYAVIEPADGKITVELSVDE